MTSPVFRPHRALTGAVIFLVSLVALALALFNATTASAVEPKTEVKSVPVELVFENKQEPGDPRHCAASVFFKWLDVPYTLSAVAHYTYKGKTERWPGRRPSTTITASSPTSTCRSAATGSRARRAGRTGR